MKTNSKSTLFVEKALKALTVFYPNVSEDEVVYIRKSDYIVCYLSDLPKKDGFIKEGTLVAKLLVKGNDSKGYKFYKRFGNKEEAKELAEKLKNKFEVKISTSVGRNDFRDYNVIVNFN